MICSENDQKNTSIRVFSGRITVQQLFTGKFSAREPKWLTGVALGIGIVSTCEETTREILPIGTKPLFCVWKHIHNKGTILATSLTSNFKFYEIDTCIFHRHVKSDIARPTSVEQVIHSSL